LGKGAIHQNADSCNKAAIDRLVHHATILELNTESYRMNAAKLAKSHSHKSTKKTEENDMKIT